jgi:hypothetical protein
MGAGSPKSAASGGQLRRTSAGAAQPMTADSAVITHSALSAPASTCVRSA